MSAGPLVRAAARTAAEVDRLSDAFARQLRRVLRELERKLDPLIHEAAEGNRTAIVRAAQAGKTRKELQQALVVSGYPKLAETAYGERLDTLTRTVLGARRLARSSSELARGVEGKLQALRVLAQTDLLQMGEAAAYELWQATIRGVFASRAPRAILADLFDIVDATEPQIQTLYDTSLSIYTRQVEALQAGDEPETRFAFMGPVDAKTRPFCLKHVGKVYTREEIDQMDNGQIDNVFLTAGGWNCRHQWIEISKFSELYDLGDKRIPEVEDQLEDLREAA